MLLQHQRQWASLFEGMTKMQRKWEISDLDGSNKRIVTLAQFRAELDAAEKAAMAKFLADRRIVNSQR